MGANYAMAHFIWMGFKWNEHHLGMYERHMKYVAKNTGLCQIPFFHIDDTLETGKHVLWENLGREQILDCKTWNIHAYEKIILCA